MIYFRNKQSTKQCLRFCLLHIMEERRGQFEQRTVLLLDLAVRGELVAEMRNLITRLAQTLGFFIKVVERTGSSIRIKFSQGSCGRASCVPCLQDTEENPPCTTVSVLKKHPLRVQSWSKGKGRSHAGVTPTIYVGEFSRSLQERSKEHHRDFKAGSKKATCTSIRWYITMVRNLSSS